MPKLAPEKAQKVIVPGAKGPPPRKQEEEGDKYIIQRRQFHPVEQTNNSDRQKAGTKRQGSEGEPENARATSSDPVKRRIKESLRFGD